MDRIAPEQRGQTSFTPALILLVLAVLINYVDRGNLSLAAPLLKDEWHISASQLGILFSAFFWTYTALQFIGGWLVDRYDVNRVLALGFLLWSVATAATGLATGFAVLLGMRLLLGVGESIMFPSSSKILAKHVPEHSRGFANGALTGAMRWGSAAGTFGGGLVMAKYGWRLTFLAIGIMSLLWLPAWMKWKPQGGRRVASMLVYAPSLGRILRQRSFWGASVGHFSGNYLIYFLISWLPLYLVREWHLSMAVMAKTAGIYFMVDAGSAIATGWLADVWVRNGGTPNVARKSAMALGFSLSAVALVCCTVAGPHTYLWCLFTLGIGAGMANSGTFAFAQTLAGPLAAGRWVGLQNGFANFSGVVGPALTGFLIDLTGNFSAALLVSAAVAVMGGLAWVFWVGNLEEVAWHEQIASTTVPAIDVA